MATSFKIQGFNYTGYGTEVYGTDTSEGQLAEISGTGANAVAFIPLYYQNTLRSSTLGPNELTPTDADLIAGIKAAHAQGLTVLLNPHLDTLDGKWRAYLDPKDTTAWFKSYKAMEVHYAKIAEKTGAEAFSVGCELESMTGAKYRSEWLDIIAAVRKVYHGELTYASTINEASTLSFWDKLDKIGVDGYFSLAVKDKNPTVKELQYAWTHPSNNAEINEGLGGKSPVEYLHDLAEKYGKHVQFTECGFRAIDGDAIDPGDWSRDGTVDAQEQADLYEAMFNTFGSQGGDWFDGFYAWDWRADGFTEPKDYHVQGRAAEEIIKLWYGLDEADATPPDTGMTLLGSVHDDRLVAGVGGTQVLGNAGDDQLIGGEGNDHLVGGDDAAPGTKSLIEIGAFADMMDGTGATFKVFINGKLVGSGEAKGAHTESWDISQFAFAFNTPDAFKNIRITFTNDDANATQDRNLYVHSIVLNGETIDLTKAVNGQEAHSGILYANGFFTIDLGKLADELKPSSSDDDVLDGGFGDDTMFGGAGADTFGFATGYGRDTVLDFDRSEGDSFFVVNWTGIDDIGDVRAHAKNHGDDVWITVGKDVLIIAGQHKADLIAGDFDF